MQYNEQSQKRSLIPPPPPFSELSEFVSFTIISVNCRGLVYRNYRVYMILQYTARLQHSVYYKDLPIILKHIISICDIMMQLEWRV